MLIREFAEQTGVPPRLLRYYEEQGLLRPARRGNGYRDYDSACVSRVRQIRGLLESGLTTDMIKTVLPCMSATTGLRVKNPEPWFVDQIRQERDRMQAKIECLTKNKAALDEYLRALEAPEGRAPARHAVQLRRAEFPGNTTAAAP